MNEFTIRAAEIADAEGIAKILQDLGWFTTASTSVDPSIVERIIYHISLCMTDNSHTLLVAEHETGVIMGYIAAHWLPYLFLNAPEGYVSELFVQSLHRGQGIGRSLLQAIIVEARARCCSRLMLINSKHRDSYQRQFYLKQGWLEREGIANFVYPL